MVKVAQVLAVVLLLTLAVSAVYGATCDSATTLSQIRDCEDAVRIDTGTGKASPECCTELVAVGHDCLCALLKGPVPTGVNLTLAGELPAQCNIPGVSSCT